MKSCFPLGLMLATIPNATNARPAVPTEMTVLGDLSASSPLSDSPAFAQRAGNMVGQMIQRELLLGDSVTLMPVGHRSTANARKMRFRLTAQFRQSAAAARVGGIIASTPRSTEAGQGSTNLIFALERGAILCPPRGHIIILSDGLESSNDFNGTDALLQGKMQLPAPPPGFLRGCRVTFVGIGLTSDRTAQLSNVHLRYLTSAWRTYLITAGVRPDQIAFHTTF